LSSDSALSYAPFNKALIAIDTSIDEVPTFYWYTLLSVGTASVT